ncbi:MAG: NAD(P)-binding domain-containing protein, partial [Thermoanaerobaculia bacterium]|nr:NAD(P)-binding domain-containing protein [Thermoanaerobaculia bacterium]
MNIGILGTGIVGRTLATRLDELGHAIVIGTRDVDGLLARSDGDEMGNPPFKDWITNHPGIQVMTFDEAAIHGEIVINATAGQTTLDALRSAGEP